LDDPTSTKIDLFTCFQQRLSAVGGETHHIAFLEGAASFIAAHPALATGELVIPPIGNGETALPPWGTAAIRRLLPLWGFDLTGASRGCRAATQQQAKECTEHGGNRHCSGQPWMSDAPSWRCRCRETSYACVTSGTTYCRTIIRVGTR
jgi:hypothetical protein